MNQVWILRDTLDRIQQEAGNKAPLETGGLLFGYCSEDDNNVVVTDMVGPGPKAIHKKWTYRPDYNFHRQESIRIFNDFSGMFIYLGDWHSHPTDSTYLSFLDKRALRNIARFKDNYIDNPIMLVLGGRTDKNPSGWTPGVWRISPQPHQFPWTGWEYTSLEITIYDQVL